MDSILSPREYPIDYEGIYSEAYALYKEGFHYWFSPYEEAQLKVHNKAFEVPHPEEELVSFYFLLPDEMRTPAFYPTAIVLEIITRNTHMKNISCVSLGRVLATMGYEADVVKHWPSAMVRTAIGGQRWRPTYSNWLSLVTTTTPS